MVYPHSHWTKATCFSISLFIKKSNFLSVLVSVGAELIFFTMASWYGLCFGFVLNTLMIWRYFCYCCREPRLCCFCWFCCLYTYEEAGCVWEKTSCDRWPKLTRGPKLRPFDIMLNILSREKKEISVTFHGVYLHK